MFTKRQISSLKYINDKCNQNGVWKACLIIVGLAHGGVSQIESYYARPKSFIRCWVQLSLFQWIKVQLTFNGIMLSGGSLFCPVVAARQPSKESVGRYPPMWVESRDCGCPRLAHHGKLLKHQLLQFQSIHSYQGTAARYIPPCEARAPLHVIWPPSEATASTPNADSIDFFVVKKRMGHLLISVMILNIEISYHKVHVVTHVHLYRTVD